jgi:hypothetical protein
LANDCSIHRSLVGWRRISIVILGVGEWGLGLINTSSFSDDRLRSTATDDRDFLGARFYC